MHLKQLVNAKECEEQYQEHIDELIQTRQRTTSTANEPQVIRIEIADIDVIIKLK